MPAKTKQRKRSRPRKKQSIRLPSDIREKVAALPEVYRTRSEELFKKWQAGRANRYETNELQRTGLIPSAVAQDVGDRIPGGLQAVADWIGNEFSIQVTKMTVSNWIRGSHLPRGCQENYPKPTRGNHLKSAGRVWVERYLTPMRATNGETTFVASPAERKIAAEARSAEMDLEDRERKMSRDWMMASAHEFTMASVGTVARNTVRDAMEKLLPAEMERALTELVADAETRVAVLQRLRTVAAAATDEWQATFCRRLASLDEECRKNSQEEKEKR